jgi:hypothetical protein
MWRNNRLLSTKHFDLLIGLILDKISSDQFWLLHKIRYPSIDCIYFGRTRHKRKTNKANNRTHHTTTQRTTTQHNATQRTTPHHNTTQHNASQHNTTQHNITQRITTQHNTTQKMNKDEQHGPTKTRDEPGACEG